MVDWSVEGSGTSIQEEMQEAAKETAASSKWKLLAVQSFHMYRQYRQKLYGD
jgi:hypothetical protein